MQTLDLIPECGKIYELRLIPDGQDGWQLTADWFRVNVDRKKFTNRLKQQYAYLAVMQSLENRGFLITEETRDERQQIHIVLRRVSS